MFDIDNFRYEIYLDEVKPKDLSVNFLQEFMDLPLSYLAPGAAVKFRKYFRCIWSSVLYFGNFSVHAMRFSYKMYFKRPWYAIVASL